jgi:hypothetical protein
MGSRNSEKPAEFRMAKLLQGKVEALRAKLDDSKISKVSKERGSPLGVAERNRLTGVCAPPGPPRECLAYPCAFFPSSDPKGLVE